MSGTKVFVKVFEFAPSTPTELGHLRLHGEESLFERLPTYVPAYPRSRGDALRIEYEKK